MIDGHGDDQYKYGAVVINFSSNIYAHADLSALEEHLRRRIDVVRNYPEPAPRQLEQLLARKMGLADGEVMATSGATEAIYLVAQAFRDELTYTAYRPTFSEYDDACRMFGYSESADGALGWLCNPNNPTGTVLDKAAVRELARRHRWLVIDQSYEDYTLEPVLSPEEGIALGNVILLHSMTKRYAVPGLRLGYITAPAPIVDRLRRVCRPWSVGTLAAEAGKWLVEQQQTAVPALGTYMAETQRLRVLLEAIPGIATMNTATNFFLGTVAKGTAAELKHWLVTEQGILIRDAANFRGLSPRHFRIAAQSPMEDDVLVEAVEEYMKMQ